MEPNNSKISLSFDYRWIVGLLIVIIGVMLILWKPWNADTGANARTVEVTGEAKVSATPDEFVFYPAYEFKNSDRDAALKDLSKKSDEIVKKLKELGVPDSKIKTNSDGYDYPMYQSDEKSTPTYNLRLTVTVSDKDLAQKVQDYLVSTTPTGSVSPQASFSDSKRKELENQARDKATKDARAKAEQSAKNLGFKLGNVKTVKDGAGFGGVFPAMGRDMTTMSSPEMNKLQLQPGENDLNYSVSVTYFVK
jgi:uncharacterized protein YggE